MDATLTPSASEGSRLPAPRWRLGLVWIRTIRCQSVLLPTITVAPCRRKSVPLIDIQKITKTYDLGEGKVEALKATDLAIEQGEYVALIGPSGSGKSTLMNTLGCLDRPTSGSYRLTGVEVANMSAADRARIRNQRIGFVFQNFNLLART